MMTRTTGQWEVAKMAEKIHHVAQLLSRNCLLACQENQPWNRQRSIYDLPMVRSADMHEKAALGSNTLVKQASRAIWQPD